MDTLRLWFGLTRLVSRRAYLVSGVLLMAVKVAFDNALSLAAAGELWPAAAYLRPSILARGDALAPMPGWAIVTMAVMALPFLWIGVTMTVRRAADAGASPWWGLLFLVPVVNYLVIALFAALPSAKRDGRWVPVALSPYRNAPEAPPASAASPVPPGLRAALLAVLVSAGIGVSMVGVSVYSMALYGAALFFGTPFVMGLVGALLYNRRYQRSPGATVGVACGSVLITGLTCLAFAIEGLLCIVMAAPIALVLACLGALLGYAFSAQPRSSAAYGIILALPALAGAEAGVAEPRLREVTTSIEIDAPPAVVWNNVVGFSELPPPPEWYFQFGIAYPTRARIEGSGVGAVRRCEFSTGPFVEPITAWEPPRRLAFDVVSQPPSMTELSPYRKIHAPHLEGYMSSRRGEFRLIPLESGGTRLEGSTWYTLSIFPEEYWVIWGEALLHRIHGRVLAHVKALSERDANAQ